VCTRDRALLPGPSTSPLGARGTPLNFALLLMVLAAVVGTTFARRGAKTWALCLGIALMGGCHKPLDSHDLQSNPSRRLSIVGTIPGDITVELTADWQATVVDDICAPKMGWPVGIRFPKHFSAPIPLASRDGSQLTWVTWWDAVKPGHCGWQLARIDLRADRSATFAEHVRSIAPSTIAFTCIASCPGPYPHANDNESEPVTQYCRFSVLHGQQGAVNPCSFSRGGTIAGPAAGTVKDQHILRPGQHMVQFYLTDLEIDRRAGNLAPNNLYGVPRQARCDVDRGS
jgi:hypothetical protein